MAVHFNMFLNWLHPVLARLKPWQCIPNPADIFVAFQVSNKYTEKRELLFPCETSKGASRVEGCDTPKS